MLKDIVLNKETKVVTFHKVLFGLNELSLAKCLSFDIVQEDEHSLFVSADLRKTTKKALFEFITEAFQYVITNPANAFFRDNLFAEIKAEYDELYNLFYHDQLTRVPYYEILYNHQRDAIWKSAFKQHNFLAFQMQLGKSITSVTISVLFNVKRTLIVCPVVSKWKWFYDLTETFKFNPLYFTILDSSKKGSLKAFLERYVIVNYDILSQKLKDILSEPIGHIIIDEAQMIKNHTSQRFRNLHKIIEANPEARITFLSATPIENRLNDAFSYHKLIGSELGKNYSAFLKEYTTAASARGGVKITGAKNIKDLRARMSNFMIRRLRKDCFDVPESVITKYYFELNDFQEEYDKIVDEMVKEGTAHNLTSNLHSLNRVVAKSKIKGIIEIADEIIDSGEKLIIFSPYTEPLLMLEEYYKEKCVVIRGGVSSVDRNERVKRFKDDENCQVLLGNTIAAGVSLSLQFCTKILHVAFTFTHAKMDQANGRIQGVGQTKKADIIYTIAKDSIDDILFDLIVEKAVDADAVIDGGNGDVNFENLPEKLFSEIISKHKKEIHVSE